MGAPEPYCCSPARIVLLLALGLLFSACGAQQGLVTPTHPPTTSPAATAVPPSRTAAPPRPARTPTSTPTPTRLPTPYFYAYPLPALPSPEPTGAAQAEVEAALREYVRVRAEAEETLNPELLRQVCVDPYLSLKMERIRANQRDGSYWKTVASDFTVQWFTREKSDVIHIGVYKVETKLLFPRGSSLPDDEICSGAIHSYRDCAYNAEYEMVRRGGRWYVSIAEATGDCPSRCQKGLPTPTGTATPTPTPTPLPTPTPGFPPEAVEASRWPSLSADLYFLRSGRLWRRPAGGGDLLPVRAPQAPLGDQIRDYRFSAGDQYVAYLTRDAYLNVLDRRSGEQAFPPVHVGPVRVHDYGFSLDGSRLLYVTEAGELQVVELATGDEFLVPVIGHPEQFALTSDNRYIIYLSVGSPSATHASGAGQAALSRLSQDGEEISHGTLFAADVQAPARPYELGFCGPAEGEEVRMGCKGFLLSPAGHELVFTDDRGVWFVEVPEGKPRLLADQSFPEDGGEWCDVHIPLAWFPDGQRLLLQVRCYVGGILAVMEASTGLEQALPDTGCYVDCHVEWSWGPTGLWVSTIPGTLYLVEVSPEGFLQITPGAVDTESRRLWPTEVRPLSDGGVAFAHQRCAISTGTADPWPAPGIFVAQPDGAVRRVASLPTFPCRRTTFLEETIYRGTVLWTPDDAAFLYLDDQGRAMLLGLTDGTRLWDVRGLLCDASDLHWVLPEVASP